MRYPPPAPSAPPINAPRRRLFFAIAPPATAPPTPPITAPCSFLFPGRFSQPVRPANPIAPTRTREVGFFHIMAVSLVESNPALLLPGSDANAIPAIESDTPIATGLGCFRGKILA